MVHVIRRNSSRHDLEEYQRQHWLTAFYWVLAILVLIGGCYLLLPPLHGPGHAHHQRRLHSKNNLKQIGLAAYNYHDVFKSFPSADVPVEHGWGFSLLPYMDHAQLYEQVDRTVPWNHPDNQAVYVTKVGAYANPLCVYENITIYAPNHYAGSSQVILTEGLPIRGITDGTSNTLLAGEVSMQFKPWGDPQNLRDPAAGLSGGPDQFGGLYLNYDVNGAQMLLADGAVRFISEDIDLTTLSRLADPQDGERVGDF